MENGKDKKGWFTRVATTEEQKYFVNEVLLPKMKAQGLIECAKVSDLVRWAIEAGAETVGVKIQTPTVQKKKVGRKAKTDVV